MKIADLGSAVGRFLGGATAPVADFAEAFATGVLEQPDLVAAMFEFVDVGPDLRLP